MWTPIFIILNTLIPPKIVISPFNNYEENEIIFSYSIQRCLRGIGLRNSFSLSNIINLER